MTYFAIPTLAGQAALAAALNDEGDIVIAEVVFGDGNGNPVTPLETQTQLVNTVLTVPIVSHVRDGNMTTFRGTIDINTGGWTLRELGLLDENGVLLFVANMPPTQKLTTAENAFDTLSLDMFVVISDTATVILQPPPASLVAVPGMLRAPYISVDSATTTAPPGSPASDNCYLVPVGATGAWAASANMLTQWNGSVWIFKTVPVTHVIGVADSGKYLKRTADGWEEIFFPAFEVSRADLLFYGCF